jgi:hypothetical protein
MSILRIALALSMATGLTTAVAAQTPADPAAASPPTMTAAIDQSAVASPAPPATPMTASTDVDPAAGANSSVSVDSNGVQSLHVASSPIPDTPANRAKYGKPMSHAGRKTTPAGN